jgi:ferredoxin-nitrite reductase
MMRLGDLAENIAGGYAHVTTRGNLQFREIKANRVLDLFAELYDTGLSCKGSGADSARNITASPTAGFDPLEITDLHQYGIDVSHRILNTRDLHGLPRKFNIAFDNAGSISCVSDTNDVGFVAIEVLENPQNIEPGTYCRLILGGITGHKDFARDTGYICKPEDSPEISEAILRVFLEHGDRTNRNKARFKYVLDEHGFEWVIDKIQEKLDDFGNGVELKALERNFEAPRAAINRQGHIGVHPQSQAGLSYIGVALKVGRLSPSQMRALGRIAQNYGSNDIRLTVWQNLIIPNIPNDKTEEVSQAIEALGLSVSANSFSAGAIACTGKWACKLANAYTKQDTEAVIDHLQSRFQLDQPINIHFTGCPNSCAQHYIGDIGCIGTAAADGSTGYNIFVGGGCDQDQGLARPLCGPIASRDICQTFESIIGNYIAQRQDQESFLNFVRRQDEDQLQTVLLAQ